MLRKLLQFGTPTVLCVGSMGKDIFLPTACGEVAPATGSIKTTQQWAFGYGAKMHIDDRFQAPGGCACNVSIGLSRLGVAAGSYGIVGDDADGTWITGELEENGVDISRVNIADDRCSDLSVVLVQEGTGERTIFVNRDVGESLHFEVNALDGVKWVFLGSLYGEYIRDNMRSIHDFTASQKGDLIYNPGMSNIMDAPQTVLDLIHHTTLLFVNKTEALQIVLATNSAYNKEDLQEEKILIEKLWSVMPDDSIVVMTFGNHGAWSYNGSDFLHVGTKPQDTIDTTGAGDAFASGFVAGHLEGKNMGACLQWGAANSHSVISHYGAQDGLLPRDVIGSECESFTIE